MVEGQVETPVPGGHGQTAAEAARQRDQQKVDRAEAVAHKWADARPVIYDGKNFESLSNLLVR